MAKATIAALAAAKGIPPAFIAKVAIEDERGVVYLYKDLDGARVRSHIRHKLESSQPSTWAKDGEKIVPFGSQLITHYRTNGVPAITIAEGDIDAITAWLHKIPALGLPGASMHGLLTLAHVECFSEVLIALDSDGPGEAATPTVARHLRSIGYEGRIRRVSPEPYKDLNEMHLALNGSFDDEWAKRVASAPDVHVEPAAAATPNLEPTFVRASDLASEPDEEVESLVDGLIPCGGTSIVAGKPKAGKTTLALTLGLCVARGSRFLGRDVQRGPVLYVALEGSKQEWRKTLRAMGVRDSDDLLVWIGRAPEGALQWLRRAADLHQPALIIIDTLQRFARVKDMNDYAQVSLATDPLIELARETGATLTYVHHAGKGQRADFGDEILGSTAILGSVDTALIVKRGEQHRTIRSVQRYGQDLPETVLTMDPDSFLVSASVSKHEADIELASQSILSFVDGLDEPASRDQILDAIDARRAVVIAALKNLVDRGELARSGEGKKGNPFLFFRSYPMVGTAEQNPSIAEKPHESGTFSVPGSLHGGDELHVDPERNYLLEATQEAVEI